MKGSGAGGAVLMILGIWVLTQVLAGQALERLGIIGGAS